MKQNHEPYRLKIVDDLGNVSYIVRREAKHGIQYMTGSMVPLALSNTFSGDAAEATFALEDARTGREAYQFVQTWMTTHWKNNRVAQPKVTIL